MDSIYRLLFFFTLVAILDILITYFRCIIGLLVGDRKSDFDIGMWGNNFDDEGGKIIGNMHLEVHFSF